MRRIAAVVLVALLVFSTGAHTNVASAQEGRVDTNILLLVDQTYADANASGCHIDDTGKVLLKFFDDDGTRVGGVWFATGEPVQLQQGTAGLKTFCAYARPASIDATGVITLELNGIYLGTVDTDELVGFDVLSLTVGRDGLTEREIVSFADVDALGIDTSRLGDTTVVTTTTPQRTTAITRTTTPTPTSTAAPTRTTRTNTSETTSGSSSRSTSSGIVTGEWDLEGDSAFDMLYVEIWEDGYGGGSEYLDGIDPLEIAVRIGVSYIGEGEAPQGCRIFAYSGPMGIPMFLAFCSNGDFYLYVATTDRDLLDTAVNDFVNGDPFQIPYGYTLSY